MWHKYSAIKRLLYKYDIYFTGKDYEKFIAELTEILEI